MYLINFVLHRRSEHSSASAVSNGFWHTLYYSQFRLCFVFVRFFFFSLLLLCFSCFLPLAFIYCLTEQQNELNYGEETHYVCPLNFQIVANTYFLMKKRLRFAEVRIAIQAHCTQCTAYTPRLQLSLLNKQTKQFFQMK